MKIRFIVSFLIFSFGIVFVQAQQEFSVDENLTKAKLEGENVKINLAVQNAKATFKSNIKLEVLDINDKVLAQSITQNYIKSGLQKLQIPIKMRRADADDELMLWYRLRYEIVAINEADKSTGGVISFSQILPEIFELKAFVSSAIRENGVYKVRVQAVNPATHKGVKNVEIEGIVDIDEESGRIVKAKSKTNSKGIALLEFEMPDFNIEDDLDLRIKGRKGGVTREIEDAYLNELVVQTSHIQTDKQIYKPNQTVNFRLHYRKFRNKSVKNKNLVIEIENYDEDGDEETVFTQRVTTSRFGIAKGSWKIPNNTKLGNYTITVIDEALDNPISIIWIKITRYDLPNFYVYSKPERAFYLPNQKMAKVDVQADYLFGKPVQDAKVRVVFKPYHYQEDYKIKNVLGAFDKDGKFTANIDISDALAKFEKDDDSKRFEDLRFTTYITDSTTTRTEQRNFEIRLTDKPIHVYLIGETYEQREGLPLRYYVSTFYADGRPAICDVKIHRRIDKKSESGHKIPSELSSLLAKGKTNSFGVEFLKIPFDSEMTGKFADLHLKVIATDKKGKVGVLERDVSFESGHAIQVKTDKIAYRKDEPVEVSVKTTKKRGTVFIDVLKDHLIIFATQAKLKNGRAKISLPYQKGFENDLTIAAYVEDERNEYENDLVADTRGIIFPTPNNLKLKAKTGKAVFRPNEDVKVEFQSSIGGKKGVETALGVLVLDRAIEELAKSERELDDDNPNLGHKFTTPLWGLFGEKKIFGDFTLNSIKNLDLSKPLKPDLELALEVVLRSQIGSYRPSLEVSRTFRDDLKRYFLENLQEKVKPIEVALEKAFSEKNDFAKDKESLNKILLENGVKFSNVKDSWGKTFQPIFYFKKDKIFLELWTNGADKLPDTSDDLLVFKKNWSYFSKTGNRLANAMLKYTNRTNAFVTDFKTLKKEALKENLNLGELRDVWGNPYKFEFLTDRVNYVLRIKSLGKNGKEDEVNKESDDFIVWTHTVDYFTATKANLYIKFKEYVEKNNTFPQNEAEMKKILNKIGFKLKKRKDNFGRSYYIQKRETTSYLNIYKKAEKKYKWTKRKIIHFAIRGLGDDNKKGTPDDYELASFTGATIDEEVTGVSYPEEYIPSGIRIIKQKAIMTPHAIIKGVIHDQTRAIIPGATIVITNNSGSLKRTVTSNNEGRFYIDNLPKDIYFIKAMFTGFQAFTLQNLKLEAGTVMEIGIALEIGGATAMVEVSADGMNINDMFNAEISNKVIRNIAGIPNTSATFTPRIRSNFAETLLWMPELITDKNGKAKVNFKMADSLTTWKLYVVGVNEDGKFGMVEKELRTFQPFFAELEPPKILTEGDEISLPVPIRNYTKKQQKVSVKMAKNNWSEMLEGSTQELKIKANSTKNAIFNFRATSPIENGKQKVTAITKNEGDAIEKPVEVRPNGQEVFGTSARLFQNETSFDVNFPTDALPNTKKAEVKIYPNMFSHVAESVKGLLKRPYGCGEQTTSSTYPNLMILKVLDEFEKPVNPKLKRQAEEFLADGYKRLLNYQTDTGFGYWSGNNPDVALTAYVLRFLNDADGFLEIEDEVTEKAEDWLLNQQRQDGSWQTRRGNVYVSTAYVARTLAIVGGNKKPLQKAVDFLKGDLNKIKDSYVLANLALISNEIDDKETAQKAINKLLNLSEIHRNGIFWRADRTPFYGWGKTANMETTALVVQAFLQQKAKGGNAEILDSQISKGLIFLLKNKDRYGVWYSTQTTVNVLDTLILMQNMQKTSAKSKAEKVSVLVNGKKVKEFAVAENSFTVPHIFDASTFLTQNKNRIEIKGFGNTNFAMAQIVTKHYVDWRNTNLEQKYFNLNVKYNKTKAKIGEEITCKVNLKRTNKRYGMVLAEIGIPPGANVDRESLEKGKKNKIFDRYDILPDRIVFYLWLDSDGEEFTFKFKPRYGINAQTPASFVYDYYNEEAKATIVPVRFVVQ